MNRKRARSVMLGFAAPYIVALWAALVMLIAGDPITLEGARDVTAMATIFAPLSAGFQLLPRWAFEA